MRLTHQDRAEVEYEHEKGQITNFKVQYLAHIEDEWRPVIRIDNADPDRKPHFHTIKPDGTEEKRKLRFTDMKEALTHAIETTKRNWAIYRKRYEQRLRQLK